MSIESLKQTARRHEQNEEWRKALDHYTKALDELAREDQVDIGLYNRVGDLYVRVGDLGSAFQHYDKAVELYREAYLPNNAIAVCKKIIRNMPDRHRAYLRIGQIRAEQGFIPDARENFLIYAERMQHSGDLDESFRALVEFCDLSPEDVGVRVTVAENMAASGRTEEAVEQLLAARQHFAQNGDQARADEIESKILALDPDADLDAVPAGVAAFGGAIMDEGEIVGDFGEIMVGEAHHFEEEAEEPELATAAAVPDGEDDTDSGDFDSGTEDDEDELMAVGAPSDEEDETPELPPLEFGEGEEDEEAVDLPMMDLREGEEHEETVELPMMDFGEDEEVVELPMMDFGEAEEDEGAVELPTMDFGEAEAHEEVAEQVSVMGVGEADEEAEEDELPAMVTGEFEGGEAVMEPTTFEAAEAVEEAVEEAAADTSLEEAPPDSEAPVEAAPAEPETAQPEPVAETTGTQPPADASPSPDRSESSGGGYVDLGAMVLGGGEEKSTRFTVQYEEPSGDEEADFAKMLSQFKEKVSENLDSSDVRAHYDLGTAYKEMGLLDEAISSFQAALRASGNHLPTYELMGQTFIEMGKPEAAVKSLRRALQANEGVEDELVGIYYYLARAHEALQEKEAAVEYYDRVFSLDINFADVTERLKELR
jgi:tetratricopeptide (TPR) repeat protein